MPRIEDKLGLGELNTQFYTHVANHHDFFKSANPSDFLEAFGHLWGKVFSPNTIDCRIANEIIGIICKL